MQRAARPEFEEVRHLLARISNKHAGPASGRKPFANLRFALSRNGAAEMRSYKHGIVLSGPDATTVGLSRQDGILIDLRRRCGVCPLPIGGGRRVPTCVILEQSFGESRQAARAGREGHPVSDHVPRHEVSVPSLPERS